MGMNADGTVAELLAWARTEVWGARPTSAGEWVCVGPALAAALLGHNAGNRPLSEARVDLYARQMRDGAWDDRNPEAMVVDTNGDLRNGQHRLTAVIRSGRQVWFKVETGVDPAVADVLDSGKPRSAGDVIAMAFDAPGRAGSHKATAARFRLAYAQAPDGPWQSAWARQLSNPEIRDGYLAHQASIDAAHPLAALISREGLRGGIGMWTGVLSLLLDTHRAGVPVFAHRAQTGENLAAGDPILLLRGKLLTAPVAGTLTRSDLYSRMIVYAWNAYREGRSLRTFSIKLDRDFPRPL
jgi:hypothetical protein